MSHSGFVTGKGETFLEAHLAVCVSAQFIVLPLDWGYWVCHISQGNKARHVRKQQGKSPGHH